MFGDRGITVYVPVSSPTGNGMRVDGQGATAATGAARVTSRIRHRRQAAQGQERQAQAESSNSITG